jgi:DNA-directed RNA polymerase subunit L
MKINVKKDEGKELQIEFETSDLTIPDLIANELLANSNVEFAGVSKDHPETGKPLLVIKSKRSAKTDMAKALEGIEEKFTELKEQLAKKK